MRIEKWIRDDFDSRLGTKRGILIQVEDLERERERESV
jgi:hypothetical protein